MRAIKAVRIRKSRFLELLHFTRLSAFALRRNARTRMGRSARLETIGLGRGDSFAYAYLRFSESHGLRLRPSQPPRRR